MVLAQQRINGSWLYPPGPNLLQAPLATRRRAANEMLRWDSFTQHVGLVYDLQLLFSHEGTAWLIDPSGFYRRRGRAWLIDPLAFFPRGQHGRCATAESGLRCHAWAYDEAEAQLRAKVLYVAATLLAPRAPGPAAQSELCAVSCLRRGLPPELEQRLRAVGSATSARVLSRLEALQRRSSSASSVGGEARSTSWSCPAELLERTPRAVATNGSSCLKACGRAADPFFTLKACALEAPAGR